MRFRSALALAVVMTMASGATAQARKVRIDGAVMQPKTYRSFKGVTKTRVKAANGRRYRGASLEVLVNLAVPVLPVGPRNTYLRTTIEVADATGHTRTVTFAELDPSFGARPAVIRNHGTPGMVLKGDPLTHHNRLGPIARITVGVQNPASIAPPAPGALTITSGKTSRVLGAAQLASLPTQIFNTTYPVRGANVTHNEVGPKFARVLRAARVKPARVAWVAVVADDGYVATVVPSEALLNPLGISLNEDGKTLDEPRLAVVGDAEGARNVAGLTNLLVQCKPHRKCMR